MHYFDRIYFCAFKPGHPMRCEVIILHTLHHQATQHRSHVPILSYVSRCILHSCSTVELVRFQCRPSSSRIRVSRGLEQEATGQQLEEETAQGPDVGSLDSCICEAQSIAFHLPWGTRIQLQYPVAKRVANSHALLVPTRLRLSCALESRRLTWRSLNDCTKGPLEWILQATRQSAFVISGRNRHLPHCSSKPYFFLFVCGSAMLLCAQKPEQ